jgi:ribonuclease R
MNRIEQISDIILKNLATSDKPVTVNDLSLQFKIKSSSPDYVMLKEAISMLQKQGLINKSSRRRLTLVDKEMGTLREGILRFTGDKAYVSTDNKTQPKVNVKRKHLNTALEGDHVLVRMLAVRRADKIQGQVDKILERANHKIIGNLEKDGTFYFLIPDENKYYVDFLVPTKKLNKAKDGDKVEARLISWDDPNKNPQAEIVAVLGKAGTICTEFDAIPREFHLPESFSPEAEQEAAEMPIKVTPAMIKGRKDLREMDIITIDPEDAKDFDDALSIETLENGNKLVGVHIADVSNYVQEGSALDLEARERSNSVYLSDRVVPMLPEKLSTEICSLQPRRVRLTYSVFMEFNKLGTLKNYTIEESVIKSKKRFSYDEVLKIINNEKGDHVEMLQQLNELAQTLRKKRFSKGGLDFDTVEVKFQLDEDKQPIKAIPRKSNLATQLVEEFMLAANKTIAEHVTKIGKESNIPEELPFLYRIHDVPVPEKLAEVINYLKPMGYTFKLNGNSSKEINKMINSIAEAPERQIVHQVFLRAMAKAEYSSHNIGHYGLAFKKYAHFTSPIRRYPDLMVHRMLKLYGSGKIDRRKVTGLSKKLEAIGKHCTAVERTSMEAERASVKLTQVALAKRFIGKAYMGTVSGITQYGLYVTVDDLYAEGLLHIRNIHDDYYTFDERHFRLVGRSSGRVFHFGTRLKVRIADADIEKRRLDFTLVE